MDYLSGKIYSPAVIEQVDKSKFSEQPADGTSA